MTLLKIKKQKAQKSVLEFENYTLNLRIIKTLEAPKLENKIKYLETNKINVGSLQKFIKNL